MTPESLRPIAVMNFLWDLVVMNIFVHILYVHIKMMKTSTPRLFENIRVAAQLLVTAWLLPKQTSILISTYINCIFFLNNMFSIIWFIISIFVVAGLVQSVKSEVLGTARNFQVLIIIGIHRLLATSLQTFHCLCGVSICQSISCSGSVKALWKQVV